MSRDRRSLLRTHRRYSCGRSSVEGKRSFEAADIQRVGEQGAPGPAMQLKARRLERERVDAIRAQVERGLVSGARAARDDRAAETDLSGAMHMAAKNTLD